MLVIFDVMSRWICNLNYFEKKNIKYLIEEPDEDDESVPNDLIKIDKGLRLNVIWVHNPLLANN